MQLKVYYLDDEAELCEIFSEYFSSPEIKIITFIDPVRAIEAAKENPPDVVFVDFRLPKTTGDQVAQSLDPHIPKYLLTGELSPNTKYHFKKIISKPYNIVEIQEILKHHCSLKPT